MPPATAIAAGNRIPLGRGQAEEVSKAVAMLIDNAYMTGETIALSGGMAFNYAVTSKIKRRRSAWR